MAKRTPKPLAPRYLLEELLLRQQMLIEQHARDLNQLANWHIGGLQDH